MNCLVDKLKQAELNTTEWVTPFPPIPKERISADRRLDWAKEEQLKTHNTTMQAINFFIN